MDDYYGLPVRALDNGFLRVEYLAQAGPRIVRLSLSGETENWLAERPEDGWDTPFGQYRLYGGHRLWHSPEAVPRSSVPDNDGLTVEEIPDGVRLSGPTEPATAIQKEIEIRLAKAGPTLTLRHGVKNNGLWPVTLAPWAITMMPLGGIAILPQPGEETIRNEYAPNRRLVFWPRANSSDPRIRLGDRYWVIEGRSLPNILKIGYDNSVGWIAFARGDCLLVKRFEPKMDDGYPDSGSNCEVFCSETVLEIETLGNLQRLEPGETAEHLETWEVRKIEPLLLNADLDSQLEKLFKSINR